MSAAVTQNSGATMVDAQLTNTYILRPFEGFESVYQGQPTSTPIALPGLRDPRAAANAPGFDPNLVAGIPVSQGARILLTIPLTPAPGEGGFTSYTYRVVQRFNNLNDYRNPPLNQKRPAYHFPKSSPGAPDTSGGGSVPRTVKPAMWRDVGFEQAEVAMENGKLVLRPEELILANSGLLNLGLPLLPDGSTGVVQQGVLDPATNPATAGLPIFMPFWFDAEGDEIIIFATRTDLEDPIATWDFTDAAADLPFANIFGTGNGLHQNFKEVGIYMQVGTTP